MLSRGSDGVEVGVRFSEASDVPVIARTEIDWGDGFVEQLPAGARVTVDALRWRHQYDGAGAFPVSIKLVPADGEHAAPIYVETELDLTAPSAAVRRGAMKSRLAECSANRGPGSPRASFSGSPVVVGSVETGGAGAGCHVDAS